MQSETRRDPRRRRSRRTTRRSASTGSGARGPALLGLGLALVLTLTPSKAPALQVDDRAEEPRPTDLVETTERRLAQLDVTVSGPREAIADLGPEDFTLSVGLRRVPEFILDNLCVLPEETAQEVVVEIDEPVAPAEPPRPRPTTTFLFYFDQHHLTMAGRANSLDVARELIDQLIVEGNRGMVVSAGQELRTFAALTDDRETLSEAVTELGRDRRQWDPWVQQEDDRIGEVLEILNEPPYNAGRALAVARKYQREERWRTQKALHLFSMVIGRMAELDPPKAVVYFADTMRRKAGDHYLSFFARRVETSPGNMSDLQTFDASHAFDRVLEEATGLGIRVFTIEARGLMDAPNRGVSSDTAAGFSSPVANSRPVRDAQDSLVSLALESGGRAFLNGMRSRRIAAQIIDDLSCVYLLSFDASHLREDTTHRVVVRVDRPDVDVHARGQLTVHSESRRLTSRLMAAFASPEPSRTTMPVTGTVVPTSYDDGKFSALVQLRVPGSGLPATNWDLGMSLISRGEVTEDASGRVAVSGPSVPVVFEAEMRFRPGPFKLVGVAHETIGNDVGSSEIESEWPDPDEATASLGPIAVLQPADALILRDEALRSDGAVGLGEGGLARTDKPTALIGIVCRAKNKKGKLRLERKLLGEGNSFAPFGPMKLEFGADRCVQFRDMIPSDSMSSGMFTYDVRVFDGKEELASTDRRFAAASPDEHPELAGAASEGEPAAPGAGERIDPLRR